MFLKSLSLQNFRNYKKATFSLSDKATIVVGVNTSGKSNLMEALFLLATGKSLRAEKDSEMITFGEEISRVKGESGSLEKTTLEVVLTAGRVLGKETPLKKYLVNGVSKKRLDFSFYLPAVLFSPVDLNIIVDSPSLRRKFLDTVLEQSDSSYRLSTIWYAKALRQRNALLEQAKEEGKRDTKQFTYWDGLLIEHGNYITKKREAFITFLNNTPKDVFDFVAFYDKSTVSRERLLQYEDAEIGAGVTLVGPHRDDISFKMFNNADQTTHDVKLYGSRGQQRIAVLQLKMLELSFLEIALKRRPLLLLDDIFSELDSGHIELVLEMVMKQQTVITTTHAEFVPKSVVGDGKIIALPLGK